MQCTRTHIYTYNLNKNKPLPSYYKYELGGQSSLRGWLNMEQYDNSGEKLIYDLMNFEYRHHLYKKLGSAMFIDIGRLYNDISDFSNKILSWNYGFGITYDTTFGPLRIEYAIPYIRSSNYQGIVNESYRSDAGQMHASLLYMF